MKQKRKILLFNTEGEHIGTIYRVVQESISCHRKEYTIRYKGVLTSVFRDGLLDAYTLTLFPTEL